MACAPAATGNCGIGADIHMGAIPLTEFFDSGALGWRKDLSLNMRLWSLLPLLKCALHFNTMTTLEVHVPCCNPHEQLVN